MIRECRISARDTLAHSPFNSRFEILAHFSRKIRRTMRRLEADVRAPGALQRLTEGGWAGVVPAAYLERNATELLLAKKYVNKMITARESG
jgi:hypothetical protein